MIENPVVAQREESLLPIDPAAFHPVVDEHVIQDTPGPHLAEIYCNCQFSPSCVMFNVIWYLVTSCPEIDSDFDDLR